MCPDFAAVSRRKFIAAAAAAAAALPRLGSSASRATPTRIILDTDPGVDDAMALFLALRSPEIKIEAITAVCGNVPLSLTLPNALRLLEIAGRGDIPVAAGAATPLVRRLVTADFVHGDNGLGGVDFPEPKLKPVKETAVELISRMVRKNPHQVTVVAIGPLTNIATVLKSDPSIAPLIKGIALMGGALGGGNITPAAEFNFYVDPEAARIVFDADIPLTMVGLDVTSKVLLGEDHIRQLEAAKNPVSQAAGKIMRATLERLRKSQPDITGYAMHDPLTVAHVIDPTILTLKDYYTQIETAGELTAGRSVGYANGPIRRSAPMDTGMDRVPVMSEPAFRPNSKVAVEVDSSKFFQLLIPRLTANS